MRIPTKIVIISIFVVVLIGIINSYLTYIFTDTALEKAVTNNQIELAHQTIDKVDRFLFERYNEIQAIGEDETFESFLAGRDTPTKAKAKLNELAIFTGPWDVISLVDKSEKIVASTIESQTGEDIAQENRNYAIYSKAVRGGRAYSDLVISEDTGKPTIIFASPVRDNAKEGNPLVGVIIGHIAWPTIIEILQSAKANTVELYDSQHVRIGSNLSQAEDDQSTDQVAVPGIAQSLQGKNGAEIIGNGKLLSAYAPEKGFLTYQGNSWTLVVSNPVETVFKEVRNTAANAALFVFGGYVIVAVLFLGLSQITRSVKATSSEQSSFSDTKSAS